MEFRTGPCRARTPCAIVPCGADPILRKGIARVVAAGRPKGGHDLLFCRQPFPRAFVRRGALYHRSAALGFRTVRSAASAPGDGRGIGTKLADWPLVEVCRTAQEEQVTAAPRHHCHRVPFPHGQ